MERSRKPFGGGTHVVSNNTADNFLKTLEPSAVRKLIKEGSIKDLRFEVTANASIWKSILDSAVHSPVELESDSSYVWEGLASLDAPDAKLHMYRVKSQWYIDYPKTVATFPTLVATPKDFSELDRPMDLSPAKPIEVDDDLDQ